MVAGSSPVAPASYFLAVLSDGLFFWEDSVAVWLKVCLLAVVQGITEFLPVSSSGHLVLIGSALGLESPGVMLEVVLHVGTLVAILAFYRQRLQKLGCGIVRRDKEAWIYCGKLLFSSLPVIVLYLLAGKWLESTFEKPEFVGSALIVTGLILFWGCRPGRPLDKPVRWTDAWWVGLAQAFALFPGISRSGSTISTARRRGVEPAAAAEFSFLMSVPLIGGAMGLQLVKIAHGEDGHVGIGLMVLGAVIASVVGYVALKFLIRLLQHDKFWLFGIYCLAVGVLATVVSLT